ncbi:hypothetical protein NDU88_004132 [Pleurodeles waltl]|uniref:Uncharacterized protein n=1 Tax=Pleurodeles waltl TaxID=8319 RepID=A0AAV7RH85_PLEWA|nr:hypothetical protein NDU88_004132 [Pleurodeles waltl]
MKGSRSYGGGCTGVVPFPPRPRHFFFSRLDSLLGPRFAGNDFIRCQGARFAGIVCAGLSASLLIWQRGFRRCQWEWHRRCLEFYE